MAIRRPRPVREADHRLQAARAELAGHCRHCAQCNAARKAERYGATCDTGWQLVKAEHRAFIAFGRVTAQYQALAARQTALF